MTRCIRCPGSASIGSVLCASCRELLVRPIDLVPEQLCSSDLGDASFYLIDCFGRAHSGHEGMVLGRRQEFGGLGILASGISRFHARIERSGDASGFLIRDLGSTNGTYLEGEMVESVPLRWGQVIQVAQVAFFFESADSEVNTSMARSAPTRLRTPFSSRGETQSETVSGAPAPDTFVLTEASGGGGGLASLGDATLKLTLAQFELLKILRDQAALDRAQDGAIRGFVSTGMLIAEISWDTPQPDDNNVKQLVRRVRSSLRRAEFPDLIESSAGFGYRIDPTIKL